MLLSSIPPMLRRLHDPHVLLTYILALNPSPSNILHKLLQLLIAIPPTPSPAIHNNPLLLLLVLLRDRAEDILELVLRDLLADLACSREHNEPVLDVCCAALFDEADTAEPVGGVGRQDLREDVLALVGWGALAGWSAAVA